MTEPRALDLLVIGDANPDVILTGVPHELAYGQAEQLADVGHPHRRRLGRHSRLRRRAAGSAHRPRGGGRRRRRRPLHARGAARRGVDVSGCPVVEDVSSGLTVTLVSDDDRAVLTAPGRSPMLEATMVDAALCAARATCTRAPSSSSRALAPGLRGLFDEAHAAGATTSLDTNWDPTERWDGRLAEMLPAVDFLFVNAAEAAGVSGALTPRWRPRCSRSWVPCRS